MLSTQEAKPRSNAESPAFWCFFLILCCLVYLKWTDKRHKWVVTLCVFIELKVLSPLTWICVVCDVNGPPDPSAKCCRPKEKNRMKARRVEHCRTIFPGSRPCTAWVRGAGAFHGDAVSKWVDLMILNDFDMFAVSSSLWKCSVLEIEGWNHCQAAATTVSTVPGTMFSSWSIFSSSLRYGKMLLFFFVPGIAFNFYFWKTLYLGSSYPV